MKKSNLLIVVVITLLSQCLHSTIPNTTPSSWTEGAYTSACSAIGTSKIVSDQTSAVPLTSDYIYLKTSFWYYPVVNMDDQLVYYQGIIKWHVVLTNDDSISTTLVMTFYDEITEQPLDQTYTIQNTFELIIAKGIYCLLKQTDVNGVQKITLYSMDKIPGNTALLQLSNLSPDAFPNQVFKSITFSNGNFFPGGYFNDLKAVLTTLNTVTLEAYVYPILSTNGIDTQYIYKFVVADVNSDIYTHMVLGLSITGDSFKTYLSPAPAQGISPPFTMIDDQTAIATATTLYSNHIVLTFQTSMMVATYDDYGTNGNIFFLLSAQQNYALSLVNMKTTTGADASALKYYTDYTSFIIELNLGAPRTFYMVWSDYLLMYNMTFLNSAGDNLNSDIMTDFAYHPKIASFTYGEHTSNNYLSTLNLWIYASTSIIKYAFQTTADSSKVVTGITINKEFSVDLQEDVMTNAVGISFQVTTRLKCICQNVQMTDMICFAYTNACTFTVQNLSTYCEPQLDN